MKIENLNLSFGTQTIFEDLNISFESTDKVGIVGVSGWNTEIQLLPDLFTSIYDLTIGQMYLYFVLMYF